MACGYQLNGELMAWSVRLASVHRKGAWRMTRAGINGDTATAEEMRHYLSTFEVSDVYRSERDEYLVAHLCRLQSTLALLPPGRPDSTLLELGAAPYLMTLLLKRYTHYRVFATGYDAERSVAETAVHLSNPEYGVEYTFDRANFNVEQDHYPYPDAFFDLVLCCELLEHLTLDPTHMLVEIHRVLKPGGQVLITTPNVLVLRNVMALLRKRQNIYGPYSGYGVYGRHNREWTLAEVVQLVSGCGYQIEIAQVHDTYPHRGYSAWLKKLFPHLRDALFVLARAEGEPIYYYPEDLYAARHAMRSVGIG